MLLSLLAFNPGVEAGQRVIVLMIIPFIMLMGRMITAGLYNKHLMEFGAVTLASFWFLQRIAL